MGIKLNDMTHKLKTIQPYFDDIISGKKEFELRRDDRGFRVGDRLDLFEGTEQVDDIDSRVNKNHCHRYVKYILKGGKYGLAEGYVILGLSNNKP
jgi:hypothetical protein